MSQTLALPGCCLIHLFPRCLLPSTLLIVIVSIMLPPMFPTSLFLLVLSMLVVGMCVGWAWGCAAMAAALKARSQTLLASQYTKAQASLSAGANPDAQCEWCGHPAAARLKPARPAVQLFIFQGAFLDARSSVVFGVFLFVGTYALGAIRAKAPKLMLFSIFGTIVMDVMCSYGVLFPSAQYTLATQFLVPTGYYVATAVVSTLVIFPESMNHSVTEAYLDGFLRPALKLVKLQRDVLATPTEDVEGWSKHAETAKGLRKGTSQALAGLMGQLGPLGLEISRGRLSAAQLSDLITRSKMLGGRLLGVASFQMLVESALKSRQETPSRHEPRIQRYRKLAHEQEEAKGTGLDVLLPLLESSSASLRSVCERGLEVLIEEIEFTNRHRWSRKFPEGSFEAEIQRLVEIRKSLREELAAFRAGHHVELLEPFRELFDGKTHLGLTSRSLFLCFVFSTNLIGFADALEEHLDVVTQMMQRRPKNAFHPPTALSKIGYILLQKSNNPLEIGSDRVSEDADDDTDDGTLVDDESKSASAADDKLTRARYRPDPDAGEPRNAVQRATRRLSALFRWQSSAEGLFALKYGLVSVALWLPMVFPRSAYFTYANRGLWALIMSQTGLGVFAGEQILGFLTRMSGTVVGAILGALAWYIGSGRGTGEPYGLTAISLVIVMPLVFVRLCGPPQYVPIVLLTGVTICLVVGYSWVDYHLVVLSNSGKGIDIAWKRGLLVIIGFTAAFIVSLFPRPVTSKEIVRKTLSRTIEGLGDFYAKEMRGFLGGVRDTRSRTELYRGDLLKLVGKLETIQPQLINAGVEPSLRGPWPKDKYHRLVDLHYTTLGALSLLASAYVQLKPRWMSALVERTAFFEPVLIADMLALYHSISNALDRGSPLPATIPLRERLAVLTTLKQQQSQHGKSEEGLNAPGLGFKLHYNDVKNEQLAVYATACVALGHMVTLADEMHDIVKELAGERTHDLEGWMKERAERDAERMQLV